MIEKMSSLNDIFFIYFFAFLVLLVYVILDFHFEVELKENEEWIIKIK